VVNVEILLSRRHKKYLYSQLSPWEKEAVGIHGQTRETKFERKVHRSSLVFLMPYSEFNIGGAQRLPVTAEVRLNIAKSGKTFSPEEQ